MPELTLRERRPEDFPIQWRWEQAEASPEWKRWDAPYFHERDEPSTLTLGAYTEKRLSQPPAQSSRVLALDDECIGQVSRWEEAPAGGGWWELGLVIYDPRHWGGGLGTRALALWTETTFRETEAHVVMLTTWGGNERMIRAAQRVGYRECGRVPEARLWEGKRWDSVRLAVLRQDWEALQASRPNA